MDRCAEMSARTEQEQTTRTRPPLDLAKRADRNWLARCLLMSRLHNRYRIVGVTPMANVEFGRARYDRGSEPITPCATGFSSGCSHTLTGHE